MASDPAQREPELRALTGARGISAWFVVLYHLRGSLAGVPPIVAAVLAKGYLAVDFFFLLSGFVIWLTWSARLRDAGLRGAPAFLWKRLARIAPLHLTIMAGAIVFAGGLALVGHPDPHAFPWGELPLHLLLVQDWGLTDRLAWNDPAWSISAELAAYLLFPLLIAAAEWRRLPTLALVGLGAAALALLAAATHGTPTLGTDVPHFGVIRCLAEFVTGSLVCALWLRWRAWRASIALVVLALASAIALWVAGLPEPAIVPATFAIGLLALALNDAPGNPLAHRVPHRLGLVSYATYLSHFLLWKVFRLAFVAAGQSASAGVVALYLATLLLVSFLLHYGVERPAQRWLASRSPLTGGASRHARVEELVHRIDDHRSLPYS